MLLDETLARLRTAGAADNDKLVELMAHVPMQGSLVLSTRRDPDFFALYRMQKGSADAFIYGDGDVHGMGAILVRDGWLDERAQPVGYLGDLRLQGAGRGRRHFPSAYAHLFADAVKRTGCESYLTGVLASNAMAIASLTKRKKRREAQPFYHLLRRYDMASIQMVLPPRRRRHAGVRVDTATSADVPALAALLDADHRKRPFGYRYDDGELEHRLAHWPGFTLADTFVARSDDGRVVGCCTAWDAAPVKRYRVMRYGGDMRLIKGALSVASKIIGCPALPREGEDFRYLYLTNLTILDDNPAVLRALLDAVYAHAWNKRVHFYSFPLYENDPLAPALKGFIVKKLPFNLYAVTSSEHARSDWQAGRPGFEMALA